MLWKKSYASLDKEESKKGNRDRRHSRELGRSHAQQKPMKSNHRVNSKCGDSLRDFTELKPLEVCITYSSV